MIKNDFIFTSGLWLGEGKISFTASQEFLKFYTKWEVLEAKSGVMTAKQTVEMQGVEEHISNHFKFENITPESFTVFLENSLVGSISGMGLRDAHTIAWEFKGQMAFEGFEVYEQQENGDYFLHAEYGASEQFRTLVEGLIWRKGS